jgi:hypothetical protein
MPDSLLDTAAFIDHLPDVVEKAAQLAINQVATRGGLSLIKNDILEHIRFPKDYLTSDRLRVTQKAKPGQLEAVIGARERPTSLARFATPGTPIGSRLQGGVNVQVSAQGGGRMFNKAWLVRLKNGNVGLAMRLADGKPFDNKNKAVTSWLVPDKVALLYGPSVDQVFRTTSEKVAAPIGTMVTTEFFRQFERLSK